MDPDRALAYLIDYARRILKDGDARQREEEIAAQILLLESHRDPEAWAALEAWLDEVEHDQDAADEETGACDATDREIDMAQHARGLIDWIGRGGFLPAAWNRADAARVSTSAE